MAVSVVPKAVIKIMGSFGLAAWSCSTSCSPDNPGIFKSVMTTSKGCSLAWANPVSPLAATATSYPSTCNSFFRPPTMLASSSMSNIFARDFICIFLYSRKDNAKGRTAIDLAFILECAAVFFNDARRDGQPKAGPCLFGGKERVKKALLNFQGNAPASVDYLQDDYGRGMTGQAT